MPSLTEWPACASEVYAADVFAEAKVICDEELAAYPDQPDLLQIRGLLWARTPGHLAAGAACLMRACTLRPFTLPYWLDLVKILIPANRHEEALSASLRALTLDPAAATTYALVGFVLRRLGRPVEAAGMYRLALGLRQDDAAIHAGFGDVLSDLGRWSNATEEYEAALRCDPVCVTVRETLGRALMAQGEWDLALNCFQTGIDQAPNETVLHVGEAEAFLGCGELDAAAACLRRALSIEPTHILASRILIDVLDRKGSKDLASAWSHFGTALSIERRYEEAEIAFEHALALTPTSVSARAGLAHTYLACGKPSEARDAAMNVLADAPGHQGAHSDLSAALSLLGDLERGWGEFTWLYRFRDFRYDCPLWDGTPLEGRRIILWTDMGRGDVIQFLRYIPAVKEAGGRVIVHCHHDGLIPLIQRIPGVENVVWPTGLWPKVDVHAPLNFLPAFFPAFRSPASGRVPYLSADASRIGLWRGKLGPHSGLTIGLSWGGNATTVSAPSRFITLATLAPLGRIPQARLVSLQHGPQADELLAPPAGLKVASVLDASSSIDDVAALLSCVDLVISVDTMIAHLAGALGRPGWTLLRYATNWRWQVSGARTGWYPTMRLFRQHRAGDWTGVINEVVEALEVLIAPVSARPS